MAGEAPAQELQRAVRDRYGAPSVGESKREVPVFGSVAAAARAYAAGPLSDHEFIAAVVGLSVVLQTPMPTTQYWDSWARVDGPLFDLGEAFIRHLISAQLNDDAGWAMLRAGHSA